MREDIKKYMEKKKVEKMRKKMKGEKYKIEVKKFVFDEGMKDLKDIEKLKEKIGGKI